MLDFLFNSSTGNNLTVIKVLVSTAVALLLGGIISLTYRFTNKDERTENMQITLLILPSLIGIVISLIGNNIAGAFSLAGIFAVIKFRSAAGTSRDILYILFCIVVGLSIGVYEYLIGAVLTIILSGIIWALKFAKFGQARHFNRELKLLMPEDENIEEVLHPILLDYTSKFELVKMTTRDLGSVFEVQYLIIMKDENKYKEFIDKLRAVNGNLKICLNKIIRKDNETL
jgi:hypothetical protein